MSRILGVDNIGKVNFAISYSQSFLIFACLGIPIYGLTAIAKVKDDVKERSKVFSEIFMLNVCCSLLVAGVYLTSIFTIETLRSEFHLLLISGFAIFFSSFSVDWYFSGMQNFRAITLRSIITKIIAFIGIFVFVHDRSSVLNYLILFILSSLISNIWNLYKLLSKEVLFGLTFSFKKHIKPIMLLFFATLAATIYTMIDSILLGFLSTFSEVGYYTSCLKIVRIFMQVVISAGVVILPAISAAVGDKDYLRVNQLLDQGFAFSSFFVVPLTIGLVLVADPFVPLFFGEEFRSAIPTMRLLAFVVFFVGIGHTFCSQILIGFSRSRELLISTSIGLVVNLVLNFLLIPILGSTGAAFANVVTEFLVLSVAIWYSYKLTQVSIRWDLLIKATIACVPFCLIFFFVSITSWYSLTNFVLVAALTYILSQGMMRNGYILPYVNKIYKLIK